MSDSTKKCQSKQVLQVRKNTRQTQQKNIAKKINIRMQKKLAVLFILVLLAFVGLSVRLFFITKEDGENYKKQVLSQQEYDSTVLPFRRGDIIDAKGTKLAYSEKVYNLVLDPKLITRDEKNLEPTIAALVQCFAINETEVRNFIAANPSNQYYVIQKKLSYDQISPFLELQKDTKKNPHIQGVWFEEEYKRVYPAGSLACDVIGFTGKDNAGTYGLEEYYNNTLNGINGREYGYLNDESTLERSTKAAEDGNTIVTTIDSNIQSIVEKYILAFNETHRGEFREGELGSKNTGVIVMNPKTGEILAMASYPTYDLNDPKNLTAYYTQEQIDAMDNDTYYATLNNIWRNFCISDTYEPGSTSKALTVSAGLDSGKLSGNETFVCNGSLMVSGHNIHCHKTIGHGVLDVSGALEQSCNVALMHMGEQIGTDTFMKYLRNFNMGLKTNIDLAGEARTDTLIFDPANMVASDLALCTFGQGYNCSQIQMATAFCSVINGGYYYQPHVVSAIQDADGATIENIEPRVLKQTISTKTSDRMREYLKAVCVEGTGTTAVPAGYVIGGKTGTAEKIPRNNGNYVVSFIGYAPADDPQVVVYVVVDEPNVADQPHSTFAQEIAKGIFTEVLPYMNVFRTEELTEEQKAELQALNVLPKEDAAATAAPAEAVAPAPAPEPSPSTDPFANYEKDPDTGNYIDPATGQQIDPNTGEYIDSGFSLLGE